MNCTHKRFAIKQGLALEVWKECAQCGLNFEFQGVDNSAYDDDHEYDNDAAVRADEGDWGSYA